MKKGLKRVLVVALSAMMVLMMAAPAFADEEVVKEEVTQEVSSEEATQQEDEELDGAFGTFPYFPSKAEFSVNLNWMDYDDLFDTRQGGVEVQLRHNGEDCGLPKIVLPETGKNDAVVTFSVDDYRFGDQFGYMVTPITTAKYEVVGNQEELQLDEELAGTFGPDPCKPFVFDLGSTSLVLVTKTVTVKKTLVDAASRDNNKFQFSADIYDNTEAKKNVASMSPVELVNGETKDFFVPINYSFKVTETQAWDFVPYVNGVQTDTYWDVVTEDTTVEFVNKPGYTPGPKPTPGGGGGSGSGGTGVGGPAVEAAPAAAPEPALDAVPKTGMPMEYNVWMIIMVISALALASIIVIKKKEN